MASLSSRERMLLALDNAEPDYVPCCFMIFTALREQCADEFEFVQRQLELGLDAVVTLPAATPHQASEHSDMHGLPIRFHRDVLIREWREDAPNERYPLLHKEYITPAGKLHTIVRKTDDWIHGDHVPFLDDYLIPRSKKFLIATRRDLDALSYLLTPVTKEDIEWFRETSRLAKQFAGKHELLVVGGWGAGLEVACWLCGIENLIWLAIDEPDFVHQLVEFISRWNQQRMEIILDEGVDLFIRRGWYEHADFWSPRLFREFILPSLKKEATMAHQAGAKFGYIMTTSTMPLLDMLMEAGVDVLIGVDPVQGKGTDMRAIKQKVHDRMCLWGGVNGFITIERGTREQVKQAVYEAIDALAHGGGFILSPVDNVRDTSERTWENVMAFIEAWRERRYYQSGDCERR